MRRFLVYMSTVCMLACAMAGAAEEKPGPAKSPATAETASEGAGLEEALAAFQRKVGAWRWSVPADLDDLRAEGEALANQFITHNEPLGAIRAFSAVGRATRNPVDYLYDLAGRLSEQDRAALWPEEPYLLLEDVRGPESALLAPELEVQGREVVDSSIQAAGDMAQLRLQVTKSVREGRSYYALDTPGFNVSYRPFGIRLKVLEATPALTHVVLKFWLPEAANSEELRLSEPVSEAGARKVFDTRLYGYDLAGWVAMLGQKPVKKLSLTKVGIDLDEGPENTFFVEDLQIYLPHNWQELREKDFSNPYAGVTAALSSRPAGPEDEGAAEPDANQEMLDALGYLGGTSVLASESSSPVKQHDPSKAFAAPTLYVSGHLPAAYLVDMDGTVLHAWQAPIEQLFPEDHLEATTSKALWRRVYLYPNGDLLVIINGYAIAKYDKDSKLIWATKGGYHHAADIQADGTIYTLMSHAEVLPRINSQKKVLADYIMVLDSGGAEIKRIPVLDCFENSYYTPLFYKRLADAGDILHTNTIKVLDGQLESKSPAFKAGNILISVKYLEAIAVVDPEQQKVVWSLSGMWLRQHEPEITPSNTMLIFDNVGMWFSRRGGLQYSRVLEFDPFTQEVVWEFKGSRKNPFFSQHCGSVQRLPNGNTLISETEGGRLIEVTKDNEVVWEFINPNRPPENPNVIGAIFEGRRIMPDFPLDWLGQAPAAAEAPAAEAPAAEAPAAEAPAAEAPAPEAPAPEAPAAEAPAPEAPAL